MKTLLTAKVKSLALVIATLAFITLGHGVARADEVTLAGSAAGTFGNGTTTLGGLTYSGSTFSETTVGGFAALGGNPSPGSNVNNLGTFTLTTTSPFTYTGNTFDLRVAFTAPAGITGGNVATYTSVLRGAVNANRDGGVSIDFNNTPQTFTFSNASGSGMFSLDVKDLAINPGPTGTFTASVTGEIFGAQFTPATPTEAIPEPATLLLLGTGLSGLAGAARRRMKK